MNCISWNVGHLAWQEQRYFLKGGQGGLLPKSTQLAVGAGPRATPRRVLAAWRTIAAAADPWLDTLTTARGCRSIREPRKAAGRYLG